MVALAAVWRYLECKLQDGTRLHAISDEEHESYVAEGSALNEIMLEENQYQALREVSRRANKSMGQVGYRVLPAV